MELLLIPKVIHYCWFSGEEIPPFLKACMDTWKKIMPEYQWRLWDASSFDFDSVPFVKEAFEKRKWAFVADYIRFFALYTEGGIYLDSDVKVFKSFDPFLGYSFFTSHELHSSNFDKVQQDKLDTNSCPKNPDEYILGLNIQAAIMGGQKGNPYFKDCIDFYADKHFLDENGQPKSQQFIIGPFISKAAEKYGYRYTPVEQNLQNNMHIFAPDKFVGNAMYLTRESYAIHLCNGSWYDRTAWTGIRHKIRNHYPYLYSIIDVWDKMLRGFKKAGRVINGTKTS